MKNKKNDINKSDKTTKVASSAPAGVAISPSFKGGNPDRKSGKDVMEALLKKYSESSQATTRGTKLKGTITQKLPKRLILDIGGKGQGLVAEKAYEEARGFIENLEVGDVVEAMVISQESTDGYVILSLRQAAAKVSWEALEKAKKDGKVVSAFVRFINPSGLMIEVGGLYGFIPNSQLSKTALKNKEKLAGQNLPSIVIEVARDMNRLILSEKAASEGITPELTHLAMEKMKEGELYEGTVTTVSDFGCFVEIVVKVEDDKTKKAVEIPLEGLVHVSEMAWEKIQEPSSMVRRGDKIKVRVIGSHDRSASHAGKLSLSMKQAQEDPWDEIETKYKVDQKLTSKVTKIADFGVFLQLEPGIEGLLHITKIPPDKKFKIGDEVQVSIEELDIKQKKISLGLLLTQKPLLYK